MTEGMPLRDQLLLDVQHGHLLGPVRTLLTTLLLGRESTRSLRNWTIAGSTVSQQAKTFVRKLYIVHKFGNNESLGNATQQLKPGPWGAATPRSSRHLCTQWWTWPGPYLNLQDQNRSCIETPEWEHQNSIEERSLSNFPNFDPNAQIILNEWNKH